MDDVMFPGCPTTVAPLGVGTWAWGDSKTWGMGTYDRSTTEATIADAWRTSLDAGIGLFDTAEIYGSGESERILGRLLRSTVGEDPSRRDSLVVATKFWPAPWKLDVAGALRQSLEASLGRLGLDHVDLYQIHGPISLRSAAAMAEALAAAVAAGLTRAVGVSNYSIRETERIHAELAKRGVPLASNQIEYSLLRRRPETTGLLRRCSELGVVPIAYSPIGQGRLTGKYTASNPPPKARGFSAHPMEAVDRVVAVAREVGANHDGRTPSEVALRWIIDKGAVPIPGAKNANQAADNAGALGWSLDPAEIEALDAVALDGTNSFANRFWQHG
ncbi:MAG: aldo/keto reductase [Actinobacteria bacterium]|nr:aldo/keto reductase [Actinomycetota bacterium]